ncbi:MAG: class I SAM-dependent methyltransferase [Casimicrobiaceae bacterium]
MDTEHEFEDRGYVRQWAQTADTRRPQRPVMFRHIAALVEGLGAGAPHVLELGCGPGTLAESLLGRIAELTYEGVDYSPAMLELARETLAPFGARARLHRADLREATWTTIVDVEPNAIVTNQALHDLGNAEGVEATYRRARALLPAGGLFANAELVVADGSASGKPGKLSVDRHLALLASAGFVDAHAELAFAEYVCLVARAPG